MKRLLLTVAGVGLTTTLVVAQTQTVRGVIVDASTGEPVIGANVIVKGQPGVGAATDLDGKFTLNAPRGAKTLVISHMGYKTYEVAVGANLSIRLQPDATELDDVVVLGYGSARKVASVVSSVVTVKAKDIEAKPAPNPLEALQGKVAGLQAFVNTGEPSQVTTMTIRGHGSIGSSSSAPLYILDGAQVSAETIRGINANDIENLQVLKDASATSIYGARAANGVIYITTKRGRAGDKANVTVRGQYGVSNLANEDYYKSMMNRDQLSSYLVEIGAVSQTDMSNILSKYGADTYWPDYFYQSDRPSYQTDISVSGGAGRTRYYISAAHQSQEGLRHGSDYKKSTFRLNLNTDVNKYISIGTNNSFSADRYHINPYSSNSVAGGIGMLIQPWFSPYDKDGNETATIAGTSFYTAGYLLSKDKRQEGYTTLNSSSYIQIKPLEALTIRSQFGYEWKNNRLDRVRLPSSAVALNNGLTNQGYGETKNITWTNTAEYKLKLADKHNVIALLGHEYVDSDYSLIRASGTGLVNDNLITLDQATKEKTFYADVQQSAFLSFFGRLSYDYNSKYFADFTLRNDASSRFGKNNRNATFWSLGLMWNAKSEDFLKQVKWLNDLRLKFSIGTQGNAAISNYLAYALAGEQGQAEEVLGRGIVEAGDDDLKWERQDSWSVGIDAKLFGRLGVNLEFYRRLTSNMLMAVPFPYYTGFRDSRGFNNITQNVGKYENKGIDLSVTYDILKGKNGDGLSVYANINYNEDKVVELFQGLHQWTIPGTAVSYVVGQPVVFFYPLWAGVNSTTGAPQWYVPGADTSVKTTDTKTTKFSESLEQNTGIKRFAPWNGGFGLRGAFKGFSLDADFAFSLGKYMISNDAYFYENPTVFVGYNQRTSVTDYWKQAGDETRFPSLNYKFTEFDSRMISNASFARLKALTIGYSLPSAWLKKVGVIKGAKLYVTGRNLLTFTSFEGPDPEAQTNLSLGAYPNTKQVVIGAEINF